MKEARRRSPSCRRCGNKTRVWGDLNGDLRHTHTWKLKRGYEEARWRLRSMYVLGLPRHLRYTLAVGWRSVSYGESRWNPRGRYPWRYGAKTWRGPVRRLRLVGTRDIDPVVGPRCWSGRNQVSSKLGVVIEI